MATKYGYMGVSGRGGVKMGLGGRKGDLSSVLESIQATEARPTW